MGNNDGQLSNNIIKNTTTGNYKGGLLAAIGSATIWGLLPIYWKALIPIPSEIIILYRIFLSFLVAFLICLKMYGMERIKAPLKQKGILIRYFFAGCLIAGNWSIYIWAVNAGHVIQTSIGYYIEPLVVCIFGVVIFKEKLSRSKVIALTFAAIGVMILLIHFGQIPWISLSLAGTFAVYTAIKKKYTMPPALSLMYETMFLAPVALVIIIYLEANSMGAMVAGATWQYILMYLCGPFSAGALMLYAYGTNNVNMITLGVIKYLSPSMSLLLGIFLFKEGFDLVQFIAVATIWVGLVFFTAGEIKEFRKKNGQKSLITK